MLFSYLVDVLRFFILCYCCFFGLVVCLLSCLEFRFALFVVSELCLVCVMVVWIGFDYFAWFTLCVGDCVFIV